ncbi:MAG: hypothetical protein E6Q97_24915 [Desulfurellales bacterium]|nr:MAG: hypothetical protein E6Q97_24915 [Desulfurellales bacterium]
MGRARITGGGTDGLYTIRIERDLARAKRTIDALTIEQGRIAAKITAALEVRAGAADALLLAAGAATAAWGDAAAAGPDDYQQALRRASEAELAAQKAAGVLQIADLDVSRLRLRDQQIRADIIRLQAVPEYVDTAAWCADLTEDLPPDALVGLLIPGDERHTEPPIIRPAFTDRAAYVAARDGILAPVVPGAPASYARNTVLLPGRQRWLPRHRIGTIVAVSGDSCVVTLADQRSSRQQLPTVPLEGGPLEGDPVTLHDVPIEYMDCNGAAFAIGDRVIVAFQNQNPESPKVVGFHSHPKPCGGYGLVVLPRRWAGEIAAATPFRLITAGGSREYTKGVAGYMLMEQTLGGKKYVITSTGSSRGDLPPPIFPTTVAGHAGTFISGQWIWYNTTSNLEIPTLVSSGLSETGWSNLDNIRYAVSVNGTDIPDAPFNTIAAWLISASSATRLCSVTAEANSHGWLLKFWSRQIDLTNFSMSGAAVVHSLPFADENPTFGSPYWHRTTIPKISVSASGQKFAYCSPILSGSLGGEFMNQKMMEFSVNSDGSASQTGAMQQSGWTEQNNFNGIFGTSSSDVSCIIGGYYNGEILSAAVHSGHNEGEITEDFSTYHYERHDTVTHGGGTLTLADAALDQTTPTGYVSELIWADFRRGRLLTQENQFNGMNGPAEFPAPIRCNGHFLGNAMSSSGIAGILGGAVPPIYALDSGRKLLPFSCLSSSEHELYSVRLPSSTDETAGDVGTYWSGGDVLARAGAGGDRPWIGAAFIG